MAKKKKKPLTAIEFAKLGGKATLKKHGVAHYQKMVAARKDRQHVQLGG